MFAPQSKSLSDDRDHSQGGVARATAAGDPLKLVPPHRTGGHGEDTSSGDGSDYGSDSVDQCHGIDASGDQTGSIRTRRERGRYFGAIKDSKESAELNKQRPTTRRPGMPPHVPAEDRVSPWGETWWADQVATFDGGDTIFAQAYQSVQMTADLLRDNTGKTPKVPPPTMLPWKSHLGLPRPEDMPLIAAHDAEFEASGAWRLTKEVSPELFKKKGATLSSVLPWYPDCNLSNRRSKISDPMLGA